VLWTNLPTESFSTIGRDLRQFITNSTPLQNPGNWHRPAQCQSWLLRSPGILSRRGLGGFLPLRRRLSDQPSASATRNPSHQLNGEIRSKGHAKLRADRRIPDRPASKSRFLRQVPLSGEELRLRRRCHTYKNTKYTSQLLSGRGPRPKPAGPKRWLFRQIAQIIVAHRPCGSISPVAAVSACVVRTATIFCIIAINRFCSTLLRPCSVS
jgi:hypothetical protein